MVWHATIQLDANETSLRTSQTRQVPFPALMLSLCILTQSMVDKNFENFEREVKGSRSSIKSAPQLVYTSVLPLLDHLSLQRGWCPQQARYTCNTYSHVTMYFIACLRRLREKDHSVCEG
jgi:hypothetical protein